MCRTCEISQKNGEKTAYEDCRCNFTGSAKAMEAEGAWLLTSESQSLKEANFEIGGFIADNDSSSKHAVQASAQHVVLFQSDISHSKKGVKNHLYDIHKATHPIIFDPDKELNNDVIQQFVRCFAVAVHQTKGKLDDVKLAIKNIVQHAIGNHEPGSASWCGFKSGKENDQSSFVLKNPVLIVAIKNLFNDLSQNAEKFLLAGSSQANESVNNTMAHKAPKNICYSLTASADYRYAASVAQKNLSELYILETLNQIDLSHSKTLENYLNGRKETAKRRLEDAKKPETKHRWLELKSNRSQVGYRSEKTEVFTYQSNMTLLDHVEPVECIKELETFTEYGSEDVAIVFYDLETGGLNLNDDILQISCVCEKIVFDSYVTPRRPITSGASDIHKLTKSGKNLYKSGKRLYTLSRENLASKLLEYLKKMSKKCILVAYNDTFDAPRIVNFIEECSSSNYFKEIIYGFTDSLKILKTKLPDLESHSIINTATKKFNMSCEDAHNSSFDVDVLKRSVTTYV